MSTVKITCTRRFQFCAGHRVFNHEGKCKNMHGHNYVLYVGAQAAHLDSIGRVIDFSVIKEVLGDWIDKWWDHGFIYYSEDPSMATIFDPEGSMWDHKSYALDTNPTAENMAAFLLNDLCPILFKNSGVTIAHVQLWETENCYAEAELC